MGQDAPSEVSGIACMGMIGQATAQTVQSLVHYGPYDSLGAPYRQLFEARRERKLKALTTSRELYLKSPGLILPRKPEKFITEIQIPVLE
jgi:effector-binding domain-containing protein